MGNSYPVETKLVSDIGNGTVQSTTVENELLDGRGAITLYIKIDSHDYHITEGRIWKINKKVG